jgi:Zn-dependent protease with chaperone function
MNSTETKEPIWKVAGHVSPAPISLLYNIGLVAAAIAMVLLPIIYIGIIFAVAYAVCHHAVHPWYSLGSGWVAVLGYVAPLIVGAILVFFMIKPLFARRPKEVEDQQVREDDEPDLFRFVHAICALVKAPRPHRIQIDLRVNASAGFRRGLLDLFSRNLTLTIGLPLVAGLSVREFGGVLAHEFGHFTQGAAMRLTFIVRSVNSWFARVVYERDAWDERLRSAAARSDFRIRIILHMARGAVWLSRRILWLLMNLGHLISCFMLRQMEFDADRLETQVVGSATFAATTRRFHLLNVAWQRALAHQQETFAADRLVDNLPGLIAMTANRLPEKVRQDVQQTIEGGRTRWFDTHPSDRDRISASNALARVGALESDGAATLLFQDFSETAKKQTTAYFEQECGIDLQSVCFHPFEKMLAEVQATTEEDIHVEKYFGPLLSFRTRFFIKLEDAPSSNGPSLIERHFQLLNQAKPIVDLVSQADRDEVAAIRAIALLNAGFTIKHKEFGLTEPSLKAAKEALTNARRGIEQESAKLNSALQASSQRLSAGLERYQSNSDLAAKANLADLSGLLACFTVIGPALIRVRDNSSALEFLMINPAGEQNANRWKASATELSTLIEEDIANMITEVGARNYPFAHARGKVPLSEFLLQCAPNADPIPRAFLRGRAIVERASAVHYRILAKLAALAQTAETSSAPLP